jgi:hypothetical protein
MSFPRLWTRSQELDGAIESHFDKSVLHLTIKKPANAVKATKKIDIKTGARRARALYRPLHRAGPPSLYGRRKNPETGLNKPVLASGFCRSRFLMP